MNWLDFLDPDTIVQKLDDIEESLGKVVDGLDEAASKVENTAGIVEKKLAPGGGASGDDTTATTTNDQDDN